MRLFIDIDDTILKAVPEENFPRRGFDRRADDVIRFHGGERFHLFFRPDLSLLLGRTFSLFTTGSPDYASEIASRLRFHKYGVLDFLSREDVCEQDYEGRFVQKRPVTSRPSFLLDDLPEDSLGVQSKICRLPNGTHIRTDAWTYTSHGYGNPWTFELMRSPDSVSLRKALSIVDSSP